MNVLCLSVLRVVAIALLPIVASANAVLHVDPSDPLSRVSAASAAGIETGESSHVGLKLPRTLDDFLSLPMDAVRVVFPVVGDLLDPGAKRDRKRAKDLKRSFNNYLQALKSQDRERIVAAAKVHHNNVYTRSKMYTRVWSSMTRRVKDPNFKRSMELLNSIVGRT